LRGSTALAASGNLAMGSAKIVASRRALGKSATNG